jgi:hypothetical protein
MWILPLASRRKLLSPGGPQRLPPAARRAHRGRCSDRSSTTGERQAGRCRFRRAAAILVSNPAQITQPAAELRDRLRGSRSCGMRPRVSKASTAPVREIGREAVERRCGVCPMASGIGDQCLWGPVWGSPYRRGRQRTGRHPSRRILHWPRSPRSPAPRGLTVFAPNQ